MQVAAQPAGATASSHISPGRPNQPTAHGTIVTPLSRRSAGAHHACFTLWDQPNVVLLPDVQHVQMSESADYALLFLWLIV